MKKVLRLICLVCLILSICGTTASTTALGAPKDDSQKIISLTVDSPIITIDGIEHPLDAEGTVPLVVNGRTLVPLRAVFEALSLEVGWSSGEITGTQGNLQIKLSTGNRTAYINGREIWLETPPMIVNGRTMVPLRFVAESLGAEVEWLPETRTIRIIQTFRYVQFQETRIKLGDTLEQVQEVLGISDRREPSNYDFEWHVYNSDYSRFIMIGVKNEIVEALYTNSKGFETNNAAYGENRNSIEAKTNIRLYFDSNDSNRAHAVLIVSSNVEHRQTYDNDFFRAQERQNFDATNAFRVNHGRSPLMLDEIAELKARNHSQDMADRGYFSHDTPEGVSPWDRYRNLGGRNFGSAENISAGRLLGIDAFDGWVNSSGHRRNMLGNHNYLGVGYGYNPSSSGWSTLMTQFFTT